MLSSGVLKKVVERERYVTPVFVQVVYVYPTIGRRIKVKVSDGEFLLDVYIVDTHVVVHSLKELQILAMFKLEFRDWLMGNVLECGKIEEVGCEEKLIGKPRVLVVKGNEFSSDAFCVFQCKVCLNVISHSGYVVGNLVVSFVQNCRVEKNSDVFCECDMKVGIKVAELFSLDFKKIKVSEFPEMVLPDRKFLMKSIEVYEESVEKLKEQIERMGIEYERRLKDIKGCVELLERKVRNSIEEKENFNKS